MKKRFTVQERLEQFKPLLAAGMSGRAIAQKTGLSPSQVSRILREGRESGWLERKEIAYVFHSTRFGAIGTPLTSQPIEIQEWVRDQIPEGGTVAEFAVSCMVDAYCEENQ